jgi:hypothetical protein
MSMTSRESRHQVSGGMKDHGSKKEGPEKGCKARFKEISENNCPHRCEKNREKKAGQEGHKENGKENRKEVREKSSCRVPGHATDAGCRIKTEGHAQKASAQKTE